MTRVVLTGGGTGGHLYPMAATADALRESGLAPEEIVFVGSRRGQDRALLARGVVRLVALPGRGLRRSLAPRACWENLGALLGLGAATLAGIWLVARWRPAVVVSFGGYAAVPAGVAAVLWRRRLVLVDLDARPGATQRALGHFATARCVADEAADGRDVVTGVPLRAEISSVARDAESRRRAKASMGPPIEDSRLVVVVMTGSLGARSVNDAVSELAHVWRARQDVTLVHVSGRRDYQRVLAGAPDTEGLDYRVVEFADMSQLWAVADVAVCRAGAATLAELAQLGIPSILVPLPGMSAHQDRNARRFSSAGAAVVLADGDATSQTLAATIEAIRGPDTLSVMAGAARALSRPNAARDIAGVVRRVGAIA